MPGDEDGDGMSALVVFARLGLYPVTPGVPVYNIASPFFVTATITLHHGKTVQILARNHSAANQYIQSLTLNGRP